MAENILIPLQDGHNMPALGFGTFQVFKLCLLVITHDIRKFNFRQI